jgi:hypothetical protein
MPSVGGEKHALAQESEHILSLRLLADDAPRLPDRQRGIDSLVDDTF